MDAIKKKMQAMKMEKDSAMDKADTCEGQAKDANLRADKVNWQQVSPSSNYSLADVTRIKQAYALYWSVGSILTVQHKLISEEALV